MATERRADDGFVGRSKGARAGSRVMAMLTLAVSVALVLPAGAAEAKPKESLSEAKAKLQKLNSQVDQQDNKYNKAKAEYEAAKKKLDALKKSVTQQRTTYEQTRERVAQMAASAYKTGDNGTIPTLLSAGNPEAVLDQISIFAQLSKNRSATVTQFLNVTQLLQRQQAQAQQAAADLQQKKNAALAQKHKIEKSVEEQRKLIRKLTPSTTSGGSTTKGSGCGRTYSGSAAGWARAVLKYAFSKLCLPYVYGAAGPSSFDCSGLTMMAYKQAGFTLGHYVPDQWDATTHITKSELAPGDLVFFDNFGHVGIYIGGNQFIHAPHTGDVVKISSLGDSWYSSHFDGASKPQGT